MHMSGLESDEKHSVLINYFESPINLNVTVCDGAEKEGPVPDHEYLEL